jgi:uncharacterized damage-inducible protein DinB
MDGERIAALLDRVVRGDPWHGSSVEALLRDVHANEAAQRPTGAAHSIWGLVLHMTGWAREVTARLSGHPAQEPAAGDWPDVGDPTPDRWSAAVTSLYAAHAELAEAVRRLDPSALDRPVVDYRDSALGTGLSGYVTVHGLIHHTVYHSGQIAMTRRLLSSRD